MRGIVIEAGTVRGEDGSDYAFTPADVRSGAVAGPGARVDFLAAGSRAGDIYVLSTGLAAPLSGLAALAGTSIMLTEADRIKARPAKSALSYFFDGIFRKYANFSGRARRAEYFGFVLIALLIGAAALAADLYFFSDLAHLQSAGWAGLFETDLFMPLTGAAIILLLLPGAAVSVRRLHDQKITGWVFLLVLAVPIGPAILMVVMLFDGFKAANKYGPSPKYALPDAVPETFA